MRVDAEPAALTSEDAGSLPIVDQVLNAVREGHVQRHPWMAGHETRPQRSEVQQAKTDGRIDLELPGGLASPCRNLCFGSIDAGQQILDVDPSKRPVKDPFGMVK